MSETSYEAGDCIAVEFGEITLGDGRTVKGVVLEFPVAPPDLPIGVVWNATPLTLAIKQPLPSPPKAEEGT